MRCLFGIAVLVLLSVSAPGAEALSLQRGINIHEWLNWAPLDASGQRYRKPLYQSVEEWRARYRDLSDWPEGNEFSRIRAMGFDFIRLTIDPGPLLDRQGEDRAAGLAVLDNAIRQVTSQGLKVVFDYHLVPQVMAFAQEQMEGPVDAPQLVEFRKLLVETARMLVRIGSDRIAFEPMNEPQYYPCNGWGGTQWQAVMASFVDAIRAVASDLTIIATGACGGGVEGLLQLDARSIDDDAILYSFHSYEPHSFTHQGYGDRLNLAGLPWPVSERPRAAVQTMSRTLMTAEGLDAVAQSMRLLALDGIIDDYYAEAQGMAQLEQNFANAADWARRNDIPANRLFVGEFGVTRMQQDRGGAMDADRYRYLAAVRGLAEQYGMAWAMWEYSNPHGMTLINPDGPAEPEARMLEVLGLESFLQKKAPSYDSTNTIE